MNKSRDTQYLTYMHTASTVIFVRVIQIYRVSNRKTVTSTAHGARPQQQCTIVQSMYSRTLRALCILIGDWRREKFLVGEWSVPCSCWTFLICFIKEKVWLWWHWCVLCYIEIKFFSIPSTHNLFRKTFPIEKFRFSPAQKKCVCVK